MIIIKNIWNYKSLWKSHKNILKTCENREFCDRRVTIISYNRIKETRRGIKHDNGIVAISLSDK